MTPFCDLVYKTVKIKQSIFDLDDDNNDDDNDLKRKNGEIIIILI